MFNKLKILAILLIIFTTLPVTGAPDNTQEPEQTQQAPEKKTESNAKQQQKPDTKTYDYEPSEKIKADSAIAFPVDI